MEKLEICANLNPWSRDIEISVFSFSKDARFIAKPLVMEREEAGKYITPTALLTLRQAQQLVDELYRCGIRPSNGSGSAGSLAATEAQLKDMRTIAFKLLKIG